jgi:predicted nucleic acid-binding protein
VILVDSSAWVEFDRATGSPVDQTLTDLIASQADISVTEPVLMEVLAGARDEAAWSQLRRLLTSFSWLPADTPVDFEGAARVYRTCRVAGLTPRGLVDCMIASIALRTDSEILAADHDFAAMASVLPLRVREPHTKH